MFISERGEKKTNLIYPLGILLKREEEEESEKLVFSLFLLQEKKSTVFDFREKLKIDFHFRLSLLKFF